MTETEKREEILATLQRNPDPEHLWECIIAFQDYHFETISGLPFTYQLKRGRNGELTKELWIDRRKNSKSLAWSSVLKAFEKTEGKPVVSRPKALGDIRGVSYLYGIFYKFGLIDVPDDSHIITITVTCGDIELCRDIANSLLNIGIDRIYQVIGNSEPTVIDYSEAQAVEQVSKGLGKTVMMGAMFGIVLACGLIIVRFLTDTTLKTEDDIRKNLHMPVLSVIPYYEEKKE